MARPEMIRGAYIRIEWCGCATAVISDDPRFAREIARDLSEWSRDSGCTIEHVSAGDARERMVGEWPCEHERRRRDNVPQEQSALV